MGTDITDAGRYVIVCDTCGDGHPTPADRERDAYYLAGNAGWSIDYPTGPDLCPTCAERATERTPA